MKLREPLNVVLVRGLVLCSALGVAIVSAAAGNAPESERLEATVQGLIGDAACTGHDQCRTLAFGAKACGGPQGYLAWSTQHTDPAALKQAADSYAAARRAELKKSQIVSDCSMVADPGAYCAPAPVAASGVAAGPERTCQLRSSRPAPRGPSVN